MKRRRTIFLFLAFCFVLLLVPTFVFSDNGSTKDVNSTEVQTESATEESTTSDTLPVPVQNNPPRPVEYFEVTNIPTDDGQGVSFLFYTSPDDWTPADQPPIGERDIFKYEVLFQRVENRTFLKHIDRMIRRIGKYRNKPEMFGDTYENFTDFLDFLPYLKVCLINMNYSRQMLTSEEIDTVNANISELKIHLKQNKDIRKFYRESDAILNQFEIFETDFGEFIIPYSWVQKNWIKNIEEGRALAKAFECERAEKVHNILVELSREIGLDTKNINLNLMRSLPSLLDLKEKMETDDIESAVRKLNSMDLNKLKKESQSDEELEYYETLMNQKELLLNDFKVYSIEDIQKIIEKFKPEVQDKYYHRLLKAYTVFAFDYHYLEDPRRRDNKFGKKLLGLEMGKKKVGTRNYFKSQIPYLKEGIKVINGNLRELNKIDKQFIEQNKDKTFAEIFLRYEILRSDLNLLTGLKNHINLVSVHIYDKQIDLKSAKLSELEMLFPSELLPFLRDLEANEQVHNIFGENWKNRTVDELISDAKARLSEEEKSIKPLLPFKASIEKNYMTYGFLPYTVFNDIKIGDFEKHLTDLRKNSEQTVSSYKVRIKVLNDTFKILKRERRKATRLNLTTMDVASAQQPIRDTLAEFDKYLQTQFSLSAETTPDTVYKTIISAYRAFGDPDLSIGEMLTELESGNFSKYQEKIKTKLDDPSVSPDEHVSYEAAYAEALKLPEYKDQLKKSIQNKDLNTLKHYSDYYAMVRSYKSSFESDLETLEKMRSNLNYDNIVKMIELDSSLIIGYYSGAEVLLTNMFIADDQTGLTYKDGSNKFMVKVMAEDSSRQNSYSPVFGPYRGTPEWLKPKLFRLLLGCLLYIFIFLFFFSHAKSGKDIFVRPIAGLSAVEEAVGRATEMGRPVLYISGLSGISDIATLASINILGQVAKKIALYETPLIVPSYDPIVYTVQKEVVREAYVDVGKPDAFNEDSVFFLTTEQFAYAAGVNGIMVREKPATIFFMGMFFAESLIMAETGNMVGAIQIAGTDAVTQLPFFITACDYTLIGEELYAASAYLSRDPLLLGTLKAQDTGKLIIMILLAIGIILNTFGFWQEGFINFFENVPK